MFGNIADGPKSTSLLSFDALDAIRPLFMNVVATELPEVFLIEPRVSVDERGFFMEIYHFQRYKEAGIPWPFAQDNMSRSRRGVLRGLHLQNPSSQGKLVTTLRGAVLDIAVDVRVGSPNFGRYVAVELSEENRRQLWVPRGFAHGFLVLSEAADLFYKCDELHSPKDEISIRWNDPDIGVDWGCANPALSPKDAAAPFLAEVNNLPIYGKI